MLTKKQFDVLDLLATKNEILSQRQMAKILNLSVGTINKLLSEMADLNFVENNKISAFGLNELEKFKVKRAVIIAAGFGSRLVPITLNTPKPLVRVNGVRMIERTLDALIEKDINEIYIVRGYLGSQFDDLLHKYPNLKFIDNDEYNNGNNINSILKAKDYLQNAYVLEADLLIYNKDIIKKYQYSSNYLGILVQETDDWCFYTKNGFINDVQIGGKNCYKMVGVSYWTEKDGAKLAEDVEKIYNSPGGKERYWDQVPLNYCKNNYHISIRECQAGDVVEIDTFNELKQIDKSYNV